MAEFSFKLVFFPTFCSVFLRQLVTKFTPTGWSSGDEEGVGSFFSFDAEPSEWGAGVVVMSWM